MSKNNASYWQGRAEQRLLDCEQKILRFENDMQKAFSSATKDLELQIHKLYAKYAVDNGLTYAEARKYLTNAELAEFKKDLEYYIEKAKDKEYRKEYRGYLQALSTRARASRLEALMADIKAVSSELYQGTLLPNSAQLMSNLFDEAYHRTGFDFSQYVGMALSFGAVSSHTVNALLEYPWSGKNFTQKWNTHCSNFDAVLEEVLTKGIIQGKSPQAIARELAQRTNRPYKDAIRLVRTEGNFIHNAATASMYEQLGVERYIYLATLDLRTSSMCRELDNKTFELKDKNVGVNYPPLHAHCRSTTIPDVEDDELQTRIARDPVTRRNIKVPASMTYKQWHDKYVAGNAQAEAKEKMLKNKSHDKEQFAEYKARLGVDMPIKSFEKFQELKYNNNEQWKNLNKNYRETGIYKKILETVESLDIKGKPLRRFGRIDLSGYRFNHEHINIDRGHNVSKEEAQRFVDGAKVVISRWNGRSLLYLSEEGAVAIDIKENLVRTAFGAKEYGEKYKRLMEVIKE